MRRGKKSEQKRIPRVTHEQVVAKLVDYHLGRLSSGANRAIEAHVAHCPICQAQALDHTMTEKRAIQRNITHVKPKKRRLISRRGKIIIFILILMLLIVGGLYLATSANMLTSVFGHTAPATMPTATQVAATATTAPTMTATASSTASPQATQAKTASQLTATPTRRATATP